MAYLLQSDCFDFENDTSFARQHILVRNAHLLIKDAHRRPFGLGHSSDLVAAYGAVELVDIEEFPTIYAEKHTIIVISLSILSRMKFVLWARTNLLIISQPKGRPSGSNKPPYLVAAQGARPSGSNEPPDPVTAQGAPSGLNREPPYPVASQRGALRGSNKHPYPVALYTLVGITFLFRHGGVCRPI